VVTLVVVVGVLVTLILLQSAGAIHLPLLGGSGSGAGALRGEAP
jgi:preprotein translocase subunit SecG